MPLTVDEQLLAESMFDRTQRMASRYGDDAEGVAMLALCQALMTQRSVLDEVALFRRVQMTLHAWKQRERLRRKNENEYRRWNTRTPSRRDADTLDRLDEDLPDAVSMKLAGYTLSEIGQHLGMSISTVRRKIQKYFRIRGKNGLRNVLVL